MSTSPGHHDADRPDATPPPAPVGSDGGASRRPSGHIDAVVFDTDGVVTRTAEVHRRVWRQMFDAYLHDRHVQRGEPFVPFSDEDYRLYVDGRSRSSGVVGFLESRGLYVEPGKPDDPPDRETASGLGTRKNAIFLADIAEHGVDAYPSTVALLHQLRAVGVRAAVVSASENCGPVLEAAGVDGLFDVRVDGTDLARLRRPGKPDPALFLEAARRLDVAPGRCAVVEDALAGVEAGRRGRFGLVLGIDRTGHPAGLAASGADVVVSDLASFSIDPEHAWRVSESDRLG